MNDFGCCLLLLINNGSQVKSSRVEVDRDVNFCSDSSKLATRLHVKVGEFCERSLNGDKIEPVSQSKKKREKRDEEQSKF